MLLKNCCVEKKYVILLSLPTPQQLKDELVETTAEMETLEEEGKKHPRNKQISIGRKKFNMDPKKGIEYLIQQSLLKNTAEGGLMDMLKLLIGGVEVISPRSYIKIILTS